MSFFGFSRLAWTRRPGRAVVGFAGLMLVLALPAASAAQSDIGAAADDRLFTVLNPTGIAPPIERSAMAPRPDGLAGRTIYLVDVTFNGGDLLLQEMQKWMAVNMPEVTTEFRIKRGAYSADDPELWREIQADDGLMIMAIGH